MYQGAHDDGRSNAGTPRLSYDPYRGVAATASRSATPHSQRRTSYPVYSNAPPSGGDTDYEYEERDLGMTQQVRPAGPSSQYGPPPARSSYSSPSAAPNGGYGWEMQSQYGRGYPPTPSSAPPEYPPYQHEVMYGQETFPGGYPGGYPGAHPDYRSEPVPVNDYYWYAGAPPSSSSSHTHHPPSHGGHGGEPGFFGVSAPHHHPGHHMGRQDEALPSFPQWSRTWYDGHMSANGHAYTSVPPLSGQSGWESETLTRSGATGPYGQRYGQRGMTDLVKEERMRMLEREFGKPKIKHKGGGQDEEDEEDEEAEGDIGDDEDLPLGCVTSTGRLVTERPKWNLAIRWLMGITTLAGCACGLGGALLIKTTASDKPAAQGTVPAYILYACSVITLLVILYLYVFRACCCDPMRKEVKAGGAGQGNPLGGMVIPVLSGGGPGGKMKKNKGFGKRGRMMMQQQQQAPTVNLIVDPALLGAMGGGGGKDDSDDDERLPGDARRSRKRKNGLGVLGNMQMQRRWQLARSKVKLLLTWDVILCILWIACEIVCLGLGKKCPAGSSGGWCDFYNAAIACGFILVALLVGAIYLDYRDLKVSQNAPKPPM